MKFILLFILFLIGAVNARSLNFEDSGCKQNQTFREEWESYCEPSCETPNANWIYDREPGCKCMVGFLRNPQRECVKEEDCPYDDPKNKCKSVHCRYGNKCVMHEGRPICIAKYANCYAFPCPSGTNCEILMGRPQCLANTCANVTCGPNKECAMVKLLSDAKKTNYTLQPKCIDNNACLFGGRCCKELSICVLQEAKCFEPSCNPIAKCEDREAPIPEDKQCRDNEIFSTCKKNCFDTKCNEKPEVCTEKCGGRGCVCQEGLFRDRFGDCVAQNDCDIQKEYFENYSRETLYSSFSK